MIGDRWTMVVLREMFSGATRFGELAAATGASRATLTKRLRAMVDNGLLYQSPYQTRPPRFEYRLTVKGSALYDTALAAWAWESRWTQAARRNLPMRLTHRSCGHRFTPVAVCGRCGTAISIRDIRFRAGVVSETQQEYLNDGSLRRSSTFSVAAGTGSGMFLHFIDVVADHWTPLVLAATFMGLRRYDELRRELGVATNILAHRLKLLGEAGVLQLGAISLDRERHTVAIDDQPVTLTFREFELLKFLMERPARAFGRDQLLDEVWGADYEGGPRTVDMHVQTLRKKLGSAGAQIGTIHGLGYRIGGGEHAQ